MCSQLPECPNPCFLHGFLSPSYTPCCQSYATCNTSHTHCCERSMCLIYCPLAECLNTVASSPDWHLQTLKLNINYQFAILYIQQHVNRYLLLHLYFWSSICNWAVKTPTAFVMATKMPICQSHSPGSLCKSGCKRVSTAVLGFSSQTVHNFINITWNFLISSRALEKCRQTQPS